MAESFIRSSKYADLHARMDKLGIHERDLAEKFILGSGHGGQKINKTSSCVFLRHIPTGTCIKCQRDRSREVNRFLARRELCDRIEERVLGQASARRQEKEKIRRQKRRRSRRQKERMLADKHLMSRKKESRQRVSMEDIF